MSQGVLGIMTRYKRVTLSLTIHQLKSHWSKVNENETLLATEVRRASKWASINPTCMKTYVPPPSENKLILCEREGE